MLLKKKILLFAMSCLSIASLAQEFEDKGGKYFRKGYKIELSGSWPDTSHYPPGETWVTEDPTPITIDGEHIYDSGEITFSHETVVGITSLTDYLLSNLIMDIESLQLPNGTIQMGIHPVVINNKGIVVYYDYTGIIFLAKNGQGFTRKANKKLSPKIMKLMMDAPIVKPFAQHGESINIGIALDERSIEIKNKRATIIKH